MAVRFRITFLFTLLVFIILFLVCGSVYYFSYKSRINTIKTRLTNRAITIGRLLSQAEFFSNRLVQKVDSATSIALTHKIIQAYDYQNNKIYQFSSVPGDTLAVRPAILDDARVKGSLYFTVADREVVAYHYTDNKARIVMIAAGKDEEGIQFLKHLSQILLLSLLGALLIAFAGGYYFSKGLLQPIKKIADDVNDISVQSLSRRIKTGKVRDELFYLSDTLNSLLNRLQESFNLQKRFIANASHELSTPLTSISSQLEVSLQRERAADEYRAVMQSILQDVKHMSKLTQTLLEFAKASGSPGGLEIYPVRIDDVLFRLPTEMTKINPAYSVLFEFDELPDQEESLLIFGNEELLFTAIKNIVLNACKYSPNNKAIVRLTMQQNEIMVNIQDNGVGIPEPELQNIFQPFYRLNSTSSNEGFGLGLSLASRIIKLHKGEIEVSSEVDSGTLFTIRFPIANTT